MTCRLRLDQSCSEINCIRPARYGDLCVPCFMASSPARRQVEMDTLELSDWDIVRAAEAMLGD